MSPSQRVWFATGVTGPEKVHAHLGDGQFGDAARVGERCIEDGDALALSRRQVDLVGADREAPDCNKAVGCP